MNTHTPLVSDKAIVKWMADILEVNLKICEKDSLSIVMSKAQAEILMGALKDSLRPNPVPVKELLTALEKIKLLAARLESAVEKKDGPWDGLTADSDLAHNLVDKAVNSLHAQAEL